MMNFNRVIIDEFQPSDHHHQSCQLIHNYEGLSSMPSGTAPFVVLDMMNFNRVIIDVETESAWVEGGATLGKLYTAVAEKSGDHEFPAGVGPTVGVGGHFSGLPDGSTISDLKSRYFTGKSCVKTKSDYVREYVSIESLEGALVMVAMEPKGLVILDPYGGMMERISSDAIAFPHRKGNLYNILYVAFWSKEEDEARYLNWLRKFYDYIIPYVSSNPRTAYVNYVDLDLGSIDMIDDDYDNVVEKVRNWGEKYLLGNYDRLVKAKTIIDPNNVFDHLQGIHPNNAQTYQCVVNSAPCM